MILGQSTNYRISSTVFCIGIIVYYLQVLRLIFDYTSDSNTLLYFGTWIAQISNIVHILELIDNQVLYVAVYVIIHAYGYILVLIVMVFALSRKTYKYPVYVVSKYYNTYLSWFPIVLYDMVVYFNLKLIFDFSWTIVFGVIGLFYALVIAQISCYLMINYEFGDINLFKRKYSFIAINTLLRSVAYLLNQLDGDNNVIMLYVFVHLFGLVSLFDAYINKPFVNKCLSKTYIAGAACFELAALLQTLQQIGAYDDYNLTALLCWGCPLVIWLSLVVNEYSQFEILENKSIDDFYIYCDEIINNYVDNPFLLNLSVRHHVNNCQNVNCYCIKYGISVQLNYTSTFKATYVYQELNLRCINPLDITYITMIKLLDSLFQQTLQNKQLLNKEQLSFQYISFLKKYSGNTLLSYFYLKKLAIMKYGFNLIYQTVYEVISDKLEQQIVFTNSVKLAQSNQEGLKIDPIVMIEKQCQYYKYQCIKAINAKLQLWRNFEIGNDNIGNLLNNMYPTLREFVMIKQSIQEEISTIPEDQQSAPFVKLLQLEALTITNQMMKVMKLEIKVNDLRFRDQYREDSILNNYNFMNDQSVIIRAGLSVQIGQILNKDNDKIKKFFGYTTADMQNIETINDLMPKHIAILHNQILTQYLQVGQSPLLYTTRNIFLLNKEKFLFPVSITVRNDFSDLDDCVFNVNLLKVQIKELMMFNTHGQLIGISEKLFQQISVGSEQVTKYFNQDQLLKDGLIYVLMPNLAKLFDGLASSFETSNETSSQVFENLQCSLYTNGGTLELCRRYQSNRQDSRVASRSSQSSSVEYNNKTQIMDPQHRKQIQEFLHGQTMGLKDSSTGIKIRFRLHSFFRQFNNIDLGVLQLVGQSALKDTSLHYFVIECLETLPIRAYRSANTSKYNTVSDNNYQQSQQAKSSPRLIINEDYSNISENKDMLQVQQYDQIAISPRFQIDSPRVPIDTPKDTARQLLPMYESDNTLTKQKSIFLQEMIKYTHKVQDTKITPQDNPKFISKNDIQEIGIPEYISEIQKQSNEISDRKDYDNKYESKKFESKQFKTKVKSKQRGIEDNSSTSAVSRNDREHLDEIYQSSKLPTGFNWYMVLQILIITIIGTNVVIQTVQVQNQLYDIISMSKQLTKQYYFSRNFVNTLQQGIYLSLNETYSESYNVNAQEYWKSSINESIHDIITILNEQVGIMIKGGSQFDMTIYSDTSKYVQPVDYYAFQVNNLFYQRNIDQELSIMNLIERIQIQKQQLTKIFDTQIGLIQDYTLALIEQLQIVVITCTTILGLIVLPYIRLRYHFNGYIEKIILLVARINNEEYQREIKRLQTISSIIQQLNGISLISTDYMSTIIYQKNDDIEQMNKTKQNLLQTKIYNVKLPFYQESLKYLALLLMIIIYMIGGLIYADKIPQSFVNLALDFVKEQSIYNNVAENNLLFEIINRNLSQSPIMQELYDANFKSYDEYQELVRSDRTVEQYVSDICVDNIPICNSTISAFYDKGIAGVMTQISLYLKSVQMPVHVYSEDYWALIAYYPQVVDPAINSVIQYKNIALVDVINALKDGLLLYIILGGVFLIAMTGLFQYYQTQFLRQRIFMIKHLLILIPREKLNEEITISMLKTIRQY